MMRVYGRVAASRKVLCHGKDTRVVEATHDRDAVFGRALGIVAE
jgi:hypothetical protein